MYGASGLSVRASGDGKVGRAQSRVTTESCKGYRMKRILELRESLPWSRGKGALLALGPRGRAGLCQTAAPCSDQSRLELENRARQSSGKA